MFLSTAKMLFAEDCTMKRIKGTERLEILDAEIVDTWQNPDRVSLTRAELKQLQYNKRGWSVLVGCGAALSVCLGLWLVGMALKTEPAILPNCQSNCSVKQGWF